MNRQIEILKTIIGKNLSTIICQRIEHKPFPIVNNEYLTFDKIGLMFGGEESIWELGYTIEGVIIEYKSHHNPFKLKINNESILIPTNGTSSKIKEEYKSFFNIGFKIGSIYIYEDDLRWNIEPNFEFIGEITENNSLGSTIIFNDETGLRNIMISCYELPGECMEIEIKLKFQFGNIFVDNNINNNGKRKFITKIGNAPEDK